LLLFFFFCKNLTKLGFDDMGRRNHKCCTHTESSQIHSSQHFFTHFFFQMNFYLDSFVLINHRGTWQDWRRRRRKMGKKKRKKICPIFNL
jgi:hypothetical protein